jgi:hypothetical protein
MRALWQDRLAMLRKTLLAISAVGALAFGAAFAMSWIRPVLVERAMRRVVQRELEQEIGKHIGSAATRRVAKVVAEMQDPDCPCRSVFVKAAARFLKLHAAIPPIRVHYVRVIRALMRELRIFTAANALVFLLLGITTYARKRAGLQLLLPAAVLLTASTVVAALYLFAQNWLHTIVFHDYVGLGYFAYLSLAVAFLSDIAFNHARVSTHVFNAACDLVGAAIQAAPC